MKWTLIKYIVSRWIGDLNWLHSIGTFSRKSWLNVCIMFICETTAAHKSNPMQRPYLIQERLISNLWGFHLIPTIFPLISLLTKHQTAAFLSYISWSKICQKVDLSNPTNKTFIICFPLTAYLNLTDARAAQLRLFLKFIYKCMETEQF